MKLIAHMCVFNEAEYITYSISSIYDYVDEIIIFEGSWGECLTTSGNARSTDGTIKLLQNFPDPENKIKLHFLNERTQLEQRSKVFEMLPREQCWMLLIDGDEVYPEKSIRWVRDFVDCKLDGDNLLVSAISADVIRLRSLVFVNDFQHVCHVDYPRLFKVRGGKNEEFDRPYYTFLEPNTLGVLTNGGTYRKIKNDELRDDGIKSVWDFPEVEFFHYSYVHAQDRFSQKKRERTKVHGEFRWELRWDPETSQWLVQRDDADVREFAGEHPEVMKDHPRRRLKCHKVLPPPKIFCLLSHSGIGNLILTTPCLSALRKANPDAHIYLLTWPRSSRIIEGWPVVDLVVEHHPIQFIRSLRRKPDAVLLSPAGALWEAGWDQEAQMVLRASPGTSWGKSEAEYMMDFAYKLGYRGAIPAPQVHIFDANYLKAAKFQFEHDLQDGQFICINASYLRQDHWQMKHLGNAKFVQIIDELHKMFPTNSLVLVGTSADREDAVKIMESRKARGSLFNACGWSEDVKDTAALISGARLVVGNDGGLMHVASALGIPTVTAFTFTNPVKNRPLGDLSSIVMKPCERRILCQHGRWDECGARGCLDVPVEMVLDAVRRAANCV